MPMGEEFFVKSKAVKKGVSKAGQGSSGRHLDHTGRWDAGNTGHTGDVRDAGDAVDVGML